MMFSRNVNGIGKVWANFFYKNEGSEFSDSIANNHKSINLIAYR